MNSSGIKEYHDTKQIYKALDLLLSQPIRSIKKKALTRYESDYFEKKCVKSRAMIHEALKFIPGGVQHNLAFNYPFPLVFRKAEDVYLEDIDGNRYFDFLQAGGPTVLGSNPGEIREQVIDVLNTTGPSTGLFHEFELKISKFVASHVPGVEMLRLLNSGTEACMGAIRIARLATRKKNIIKMGGAYHGWSDQLAYGIRIPGSRHFEASGIPPYIFRHTQEFFPNDLESLERVLWWNKFRGGTAAVIIEPMGPESGTRPLDYDFNAGVRRLCDKYKALLIFDEVVTAFRIGLSGAQGYFNVIPDITIFGKVIAGGYPSAGGIGGKKEYMSYLAAGIKGGGQKKALIGGTLAANPLSAAAGYFALTAIKESSACEKAGAMGDRLISGLKRLITRYQLPYVAYNQGSICHLETVGTMLLHINLKKFWTIGKVIKEAHLRKRAMEEMGAAYMAEGIVTLAGSRLYTSAAYDEKKIDKALEGFDRVFQNVEGVG